MLRHALDGLLRKCAQHDQVHPALQVVRHIAQLFPGIEPFVSLIDEHRRSAQAYHPGLERQPGSQGRFLEEHDDLSARERPPKICRTRLHHSSEMQNRIDAGGAEIASRDQIGTPKYLRHSPGSSRRNPALHMTIQL